MILELASKTNRDDTIGTYEELGLRDSLLRGIRDFSQPGGTVKPGEIQKHALAPIISGRDVLVQSPCFADQMDTMLIGTLQRVDPDTQATQALLLTPTRELTDHILKCCNAFSGFMHIRILPWIAAPSTPAYREDLQKVRNGVHLVTSTPGRIHDAILRRHLDVDQLKMVVLHRADDLFARGFGEAMRHLFETLPKAVQIVTLCESCAGEEEMLHFSSRTMRDPAHIVFRLKKLPEGWKHFNAYVNNEADKPEALKDLLEELPVVNPFIYFSTREKANTLDENVRGITPNTVSICSDDDQRAITTKVDGEDESHASWEMTDPANFEANQSTENALKVPLAINYDLPLHNGDYANRLDRLEPVAKKGGVVINLISAGETTLMRGIEYAYHINIDVLSSDITDLLN